MNTLRIRIFVDFWNLQLTLRDLRGRNYKLDWAKLSPCLVTEAETLLGTPLQFEGTHVYLSYNPNAPGDRSLLKWSTDVLDRFPGVRVICKERKAKKPPFCPTCHQTVADCPHCGNPIARTVEKGIDTAMVTDMISLAWEDAWDVAVLVSSDHDFIPAIEFLTNKGQRVINAHFPPIGIHLARTCWASIDFQPLLNNLSR